MSSFIAYYTSPIGILKIRCTNEFVAAVIFLNDDSAIDGDNPNELTQLTITQLDEYFKGNRKSFDLPLKQQGTSFQEKIWALLYQIPYGKIISYAALAKQYGDIKAIRAVASANGKNNLPIIVPCHRVIGSNATLTGYAGGLWRKQWLLDHEARVHSGVQKLF